jgi:hypothetical protein
LSNDFRDPVFLQAWMEVGKLTPVLDEREERTGYEHPLRDAVLGGLVLLVILGGPLLVAWVLR